MGCSVWKECLLILLTLVSDTRQCVIYYFGFSKILQGALPVKYRNMFMIDRKKNESH